MSVGNVNNFFALCSYENHWISLFKHYFQHSIFFYIIAKWRYGEEGWGCSVIFFSLSVLNVSRFVLQKLFNTMMYQESSNNPLS